MSSYAMAARMMLRPILPNPLIPTLIAMAAIIRRILSSVVHVLYSLAVVVLALVLSPWFLYQAIRYRKYVGSLGQRMGVLPVTFNLDGDDSIWIHAVSVGEALTARALIPELRERYPDLKIFLSTTTMTGQQIARERLSDLDAVFFFPFDLQPFVSRTLRLVRPRLFIMMETEIWPNLLRACRKAGVKTLMANGRISARHGNSIPPSPPPVRPPLDWRYPGIDVSVGARIFTRTMSWDGDATQAMRPYDLSAAPALRRPRRSSRACGSCFAGTGRTSPANRNPLKILLAAARGGNKSSH